MDWANETWVKLYRRDTADWMLLSWRARGLFCLLLRAVNRRGELDLGRTGPRAVAALVYAGGDVDAVVAALAELTADGCVTIEGPTLRVRNYVEAQEATASQALRAKMYRERITKSDGTVTGRDGTVTKSDATVTPSRAPSRRVTNRIEEKRREESYDGAVAPSPPDDAKPSPGGSGAAPTGAPAEPAKGRRRSEPRPDAPAPLPGTPAARAVASLASTSRLREIVRRPHALCAAAVEAYPAVNVPTEIARAEAWLVANPANAKRDGDRYLNMWLSRAQERAPRVGGNDTSPAAPQRAPTFPWARPEPVQSGTNRVIIDGVWYDRATQHDEIEALLAKKFNGGRRNG